MRRIYHIQIGITQYKKQFYIQRGVNFSTVKRLIQHYSKNDIQRGDISFKLRKGFIVDFKINIRTVDRWIIKPQDIFIEPQKFDGGNFGSIFRGLLFGEKVVAVKAFKIQFDNVASDNLSTARNLKLEQDLEQEIETIKILQHENIVLLHG